MTDETMRYGMTLLFLFGTEFAVSTSFWVWCGLMERRADNERLVKVALAERGFIPVESVPAAKP